MHQKGTFERKFLSNEYAPEGETRLVERWTKKNGEGFLPRHLTLVLLKRGTIERAHGVGDVPAQAREPAAMGGSERLVALVRCCLAHGGAARL